MMYAGVQLGCLEEVYTAKQFWVCCVKGSAKVLLV